MAEGCSLSLDSFMVVCTLVVSITDFYLMMESNIGVQVQDRSLELTFAVGALQLDANTMGCHLPDDHASQSCNMHSYRCKMLKTSLQILTCGKEQSAGCFQAATCTEVFSVEKNVLLA